VTLPATGSVTRIRGVREELDLKSAGIVPPPIARKKTVFQRPSVSAISRDVDPLSRDHDAVN
jgi:hypothetical protein